MTAFLQPALSELTDQQVRYAPPARRREQVAKAQRLMDDVDPARAYPYQFVCFRLTDFRSDAYPDLLVSGADLKHDLALFVIQVERSLPAVPIEQAGEEVLTTAWFDTLTVRVPGRAAEVVRRARDAGIHLRQVDDDHVGISVSETTRDEHLELLVEESPVLGALHVTSEFKSHPCIDLVP